MKRIVNIRFNLVGDMVRWKAVGFPVEELCWNVVPVDITQPVSLKRFGSSFFSYNPIKLHQTSHGPLGIGEMKPNNSHLRHRGSVDLDQLKGSEAYGQRIDQSKNNAVNRKYAICFGYLGTKYQGLQINPDASTIEAELERALLLCGGIRESDFGHMQKIQWTRAARTGPFVHTTFFAH